VQAAEIGNQSGNQWFALLPKAIFFPQIQKQCGSKVLLFFNANWALGINAKKGGKDWLSWVCGVLKLAIMVTGGTFTKHTQSLFTTQHTGPANQSVTTHWSSRTIKAYCSFWKERP